MGWRLDAFLRNVVMLSNRRKRACSGSSVGGAGSPGSLSLTSVPTLALSGALALVAATPEHLGVAEPGVGRELLRRAGLADARLADEHEQPAATRQGVLQPGPQLVHLLLPPDDYAPR